MAASDVKALFEGLDRLNQGLTQYATGQAVSSAQKEIEKIQQMQNHQSLLDQAQVESQKQQTEGLFAQLGSQTIDQANKAVEFARAKEPDPIKAMGEIKKIGNDLFGTLVALGQDPTKARTMASGLMPEESFETSLEKHRRTKEVEADVFDPRMFNNEHAIRAWAAKHPEDKGVQKLISDMDKRNQEAAALKDKPTQFQREKEERQVYQFEQTKLADLGKAAALSKSRSVASKAEAQIARVKNVRALADRIDPISLERIDPQYAQEVVSAVATVINQGYVPTEHVLDNLMPNTHGTAMARVKQFISSRPEEAKVGHFLHNFFKTALRESVSARSVAERGALTSLKSHLGLTKNNKEQFISIASEMLETTPDEIFLIKSADGKRVVDIQTQGSIARQSARKKAREEARSLWNKFTKGSRAEKLKAVKDIYKRTGLKAEHISQKLLMEEFQIMEEMASEG